MLQHPVPTLEITNGQQKVSMEDVLISPAIGAEAL